MKSGWISAIQPLFDILGQLKPKLRHLRHIIILHKIKILYRSILVFSCGYDLNSGAFGFTLRGCDRGCIEFELRNFFYSVRVVLPQLRFNVVTCEDSFFMITNFVTKISVAAVSTVVLLGAFSTSAHAAILGEYTFEAPPNPASPNATNVVPGLTFTPFEYVGSGSDNFPVGYNPANPPQNNGGKSFSANSFSPDAVIDVNNSDSDDYFSFQITAAPSNSFSLNALQFVTQPNGNAAPTNIQLRSSLDNFMATLFDGVLGPKNVWTSLNIPLNLNGLTDITFRLYPYGENNNNGAKNLDIDAIVVQGDAVPTPALLPGLFALGAGALRKRKQQTAGALG
jgi:hypothetical protein